MAAHDQLTPHRSDRAGTRHPDEPLRVVLADNHASMRRSLHLMLEDEHDIRVVAGAADISAMMRCLRQHQPRVLVLDLGMHNGSSLEVVIHLREQVSAPEIVVLTMKDNPAFARRAIKAGAIGFVLKENADGELPRAIRSASRGREYVSVSMRAGLDLLRGRVEANA